MQTDNLKIKSIICFASTMLTAVVTTLFFLDTSLDWNTYKVISCIIVDIWIFSLIPSFRYGFFKLKTMSMKESVDAGLKAASGIFLPLLIAPYYAVIYYFKKA